jgi:chromatin assembly factor 1 subunit A
MQFIDFQEIKDRTEAERKLEDAEKLEKELLKEQKHHEIEEKRLKKERLEQERKEKQIAKENEKKRKLEEVEEKRIQEESDKKQKLSPSTIALTHLSVLPPKLSEANQDIDQVIQGSTLLSAQDYQTIKIFLDGNYGIIN